jgi:hypothetical protein
MTPSEPAAGFAWLDALRRSRGAWLDAAGFGPEEAPWREVLCRDGMRLRAYGEPTPGPVLLIVPAPIKRPYIWDLAPGRSVVRRALAAGCNVGLIEWVDPEGDAAGRGLDDYADRLIGTALAASCWWKHRCASRWEPGPWAPSRRQRPPHRRPCAGRSASFPVR